MATSEAKEIKKQETLVRFSIISYKTRLRVAAIYIGRNQSSINSIVGLFEVYHDFPGSLDKLAH